MITDLMNYNNWSRAEVARRSGLSTPLISQLINGQKTYLTKLEHKRGLAKLLGIDIEEFDRITGGY
jgi:transcriptional regulator with XRE-family HTH domain